MTAFRHSAASLASFASPAEQKLSERIADHLKTVTRRNPGPAERKSWDRSLPVLARDLVDAGLGNVEMLVEYQLPLTSRRADVILAGVDHGGLDTYLVVELKQWSRAELYEDDPDLVLVEGVPGGPRLHPVVQVKGYCEYLRDFVGVFDGRGPVPDVRIGDWSRPWNVKSDRAVGDAPASSLWATSPGGFGQVGCVYTAQGFEYDWNGVVFGPDLVVRDGRFVAVREATKDPVFKKDTPPEEYDRLVRHTYKVLLTRGMIGTVLYSTDAETREFLERSVARRD